MKNKKQTGLTLIELIIVLTVTAIISSVAAMKISSSSGISLSTQALLFSNQVRQARNLAISWGCELEVRVTAGNYQVRSLTDYSASGKSECANGNLITNPATQDTFSINIASDLSFSTTGSLYFDGFGRSVDALSALISTDTSFTITDGIDSWQVTVSPVSSMVTLVQI